MGTGEGKGVGGGATATSFGKRKTFKDIKPGESATFVKRDAAGKVTSHDAEIEVADEKIVAKDKESGAVLGTFSKGKKDFAYEKDAQGNTLSLHEVKGTPGQKVIPPDAAAKAIIEPTPEFEPAAFEIPEPTGHKAKTEENRIFPPAPLNDWAVPIAEEAKETETKAAVAAAKELAMQPADKWQETYDRIDKIRAGSGIETKSQLPDAVKEITKGQPVSEAIYRLADQGQMSEFLIKHALQGGMHRDMDKVEKARGAKPESKYFDMNSLTKQFDDALKFNSSLDPSAYSNLTSSEKAMLVYYTKYGDESINPFLRELTGALTDLGKITDPQKKAEAETVLSQYMGLKSTKQTALMAQMLMNALAKMPKFKGTVYRGSDYLDNINPGDVTYDGSFLSTTTNEAREGFWHKSGQFAIATTRGVDISPFSWYGGEEKEVLLFPGMIHRADLKTSDFGKGIGSPNEMGAAKTFVGLREMANPTAAIQTEKTDKRPGKDEPLIQDYRGPVRELTPEQIKKLATIRDVSEEQVKQDEAAKNASVDERITKVLAGLSGNARKVAEEIRAGL
jgi:hypothetical protein